MKLDEKDSWRDYDVFTWRNEGVERLIDEAHGFGVPINLCKLQLLKLSRKIWVDIAKIKEEKVEVKHIE